MIVFAHTKGFLNIGLFLKKEISALSGFPPFSNKPPPPPSFEVPKVNKAPSAKSNRYGTSKPTSEADFRRYNFRIKIQ